MKKVKAFLSEVVSWASKQDSILGVSLVGSYARDAARPDSDVDLVLLSKKPIELLANSKWLSTFGEVVSNRHGDYSLVQFLYDPDNAFKCLEAVINQPDAV